MRLIKGMESMDQSKLRVDGHRRRPKLKAGKYKKVKARVRKESHREAGLSAAENLGR